MVIAAAIAVVYLSGVDRCESSSGTSTCYSATPWSLPIILLVLGIGAAIMVFSILPIRKLTARHPAVGEENPLEEPLETSRRQTDNHEFSQVKHVPKARRVTHDLGADKFQGREADFENATQTRGEEPASSALEERRLQDWDARLAEREGILQAIEEKLRWEREELEARILALGKRSSSRVEPDEIGTPGEAAIVAILARLDTIEQRLAHQETVAAGLGNPAPALKDERLGSTEPLEQAAKRLADELDLDGGDLLAASDSRLELEKDFRYREEAFRAELEQFIGGGLVSSEERTADEAVNQKRVEPPIAAIEAREPTGAEPALPKPGAPEREPESRPPLAPTPTGKDASEGDLARAIEGTVTIPVTKSAAVEHISGVLQAAKKAVRSARDVTEVREILERARASFDAGQYEEAMRQSDRILSLLRPTSAEVRGGRGRPADQ